MALTQNTGATRQENDGTVRESASSVVFFDETCSWRNFQTGVAFVGALVVASFSAWLLFQTVTDQAASIALRLTIGGTFGLGFLLLFGFCAAKFAIRLAQPPQRVRLDDSGLNIGGVPISWSQIERITFRGISQQAWIYFALVSPKPRRYLVPGRSLNSQEWHQLAERLNRFVRSSGHATAIDIRVEKR